MAQVVPTAEPTTAENEKPSNVLNSNLTSLETKLAPMNKQQMPKGYVSTPKRMEAMGNKHPKMKMIQPILGAKRVNVVQNIHSTRKSDDSFMKSLH